MDRKGDKGCRDGPKSDAQWRDRQLVLQQDRLDEQNRSQGDKNILAKKGADVVGAGGVSINEATAVFRKTPQARLCRTAR